MCRHAHTPKLVRRAFVRRGAAVQIPMVLLAVAGTGISMGAGVWRQPQPEPAPARPLPQPLFTIDLRNEVPLPQIIDLIRKDQGIQVIYADDLSEQKVYLPAPVSVPANQVLRFLTILLEQKGYTLIQNSFGIYMIVPKDNIPSIIGAEQASTQVVDVKGLKPSALQSHVALIGGLAQAVYNDDLGVIIATDSPGKIDLLRQLVAKIVEVRNEVQFIPFEVRNISAVTARERILALAGEMTSTPGSGPAPGVPTPSVPGSKAAPGANQGGSATAQSSSNLTFQLMVAPQSNSLLFRGRPEERAYVEALLAIVDVPSRMQSIFYEVGVRAAEVIAFQGSREGLGEVATYTSTNDEDTTGLGLAAPPRPGNQNQPMPGQQQQQNQGAANTAGFVIYPEAGGFMFHGTPEQHDRIKQLATDLKQLSQGDLITMEFYKLKHAKAADVVGIIGSLLGEDGGSGNQGSILGNDLGRNQNRQRSTNRDRPTETFGGDRGGRDRGSSSSDAGGLGSVGNDETTVIEDQKNNQVIVKTRQRLQQDFAKLIQRLDSRRPQVYVNAQIVAVTESQNNRLAVETQILAGQFGLNTNFGLGSFGEMGDFQSRKDVNTGLPGLTAALIRSDSVPFIITALQNNSDSRILATPQLLVDDNEPANVLSENEVPTAVTQSVNGGQPITSVGEPVRAGTSLEVTPQISENAVKLDVYIEQSAFTGEATDTLPPPVQRNSLGSLVTVPRDCTIVIGGLTFESDTKTVVKVPLIGDIPLFGHLFRDTVTRKQRTTLYVFLTPTIMTDPSFADLRLLTKGPAADVSLDSDHMMPPPGLSPMKIGSPMAPTPFRDAPPELPRRPVEEEAALAPAPASAPAPAPATPAATPAPTEAEVPPPKLPRPTRLGGSSGEANRSKQPKP